MTTAPTPTEALPTFPMPRISTFDPPTGYDEARRHGGMVRVRLWDGRPAWLVTGHAQVRALLADDRISADRRNPGFPFPSSGRATLETTGRTFITMDPPEHTRLRRVFTRYFAVRRIEALRPVVERVADDLVDELLAEEQPVDLLAAFAAEVPARVICHLLGIHQDDRFWFQELDRERNLLATSPKDVARATEEQLAYIDRLVAEKEQTPDDGLISVLVAEQLREGAIDREELVAAIRLLITAGHETTTNMIGLGVVTLLRHPDQAAELRSDPSLMRNAVEELLRYVSIFHISPTRVATATFTVGEHVIAEGDGVIPVVAGANRDPDVFLEPAGFDIHRRARGHVAFGFGVHQCIGQPLARLELQVAIGTLLRRVPDLRLAVPADDLAVEEYAFLSLVALPVAWNAEVARPPSEVPR